MNIEQQRKVVEALEAGRAKIDTPEKWTKGAFARDVNGNPVDDTAPTAVCFCSLGALSLNQVSASVHILNSCANGYDNIVNFNDADETTHEQVIAVWDKAIEKAKDKLVVLNLERLIQAVEQQPETSFDLSYFRKDQTAEDNVCGTLFCTVGLACTLPEFSAIGFELKAQPSHRWDLPGVVSYKAYVNDVDVYMAHETDTTFGNNAFERLFDCRGCGIMDDSHPNFVLYDADEPDDGGEIDESVTDKQLALWRLNEQLAIYKEKLA